MTLLAARRFRIATDDASLQDDLEAARIDGLAVFMRLAAAEGAAHGLPFHFTVEIIRDVAAPLFVAWLYDRVIKRKRSKTTIGGVKIPANIEQLTIIVTGRSQIGEHQKRRPRKKDQQKRTHTNPPQGKTRKR